MDLLAVVATGEKKPKVATVRFETHRMRESGAAGVERPPLVEEFLGLDRARLAALGYALDGPTSIGDRFTGEIRIVQVVRHLGAVRRREVVDEIDERVATRLLNEVRIPRAGDLSVSIDQLQGEVDTLMP